MVSYARSCDHTRLGGQHISCRSSTGRCLFIIHPIARSSRLVISIFSHFSRNSCSVSVSLFRITRGGDKSHTVVLVQGGRFFDKGHKSLFHSMTNVSIPEVSILKNNATFAVSFPINICIKLGSVSLNVPT